VSSQPREFNTMEVTLHSFHTISTYADYGVFCGEEFRGKQDQENATKEDGRAAGGAKDS